jgi:hypothetical protein
MRTEILLYGSDVNAEAIGTIDLYNDEPIALKYAIQDIKDIGTTKSEHSLSYSIPSTKNNNELLDYIYNIGSDSNFDPRVKTRCVVQVDGVPVISGYLQLTNIKVENNVPISYEVVIYGDTIDLIKNLGDSVLQDLDFSETNHKATVAAIKHSWSADTSNLGYYYGLIENGQNFDIDYLNGVGNTSLSFQNQNNPFTTGNTRGLTYTDFTIALSVKKLFDKIFAYGGYSYQSTTLNTNVFKDLVIPFNGTIQQGYTKDYTDQYVFDYNITGNTFDPSVDIPFTVPVVDQSNQFNTATTKFTSASNTGQEFICQVKYTYAFPIFSAFGMPFINAALGPNATFHFYRSSYNGGTVPFHSTQIDVLNSTGGTLSVTTPSMDNIYSNQFYPLSIGEQVWVKVWLPKTSSNRPTIYSDGTFFKNNVLSVVTYSGDVVTNNFLPKNIKMVDFLKSTSTMFNLVFAPDKENPRVINIETRDIYFATGETKDWTDRVDIKNVDEKLLSELVDKKIIFKYKDDKDWYNTDYKDNVKEAYGTHQEVFTNEWIDGEKKIEVLFSPTPCDVVKGSDSLIIPHIIKIDGNSGQYVKTESNLRILFKKTIASNGNNRIRLISPDNAIDNAFYPYMGHLQDPTVSTGTYDLNFGQLEYLYYDADTITPNNLVYAFYRNQLNEINDKNGKLIKVKAPDLTAEDVNKFNYNDIIFIDGLTPDGGHYFRVNKLDYNVNVDGSAILELIRLATKPKLVLPPARKPRRKFDTIYYGSGTVRNDIKNGGFVVGADNTGGGTKTGLIEYTGATSVKFPLTRDTNFIYGDRNVIQSETSFIMGDDNVISDNVEKIQIYGSKNTIDASNNSGETISNVVIYGDDVTATKGDTLYVQNIQLTSSASTINGIVVSAITAGGTYWESGNTSHLSANTAFDTVYVPDLVIDSTKVIKSSIGGGELDLHNGTNEVLLSIDNGAWNKSQLYLSPGYIELSQYETGGLIGFYTNGGNITVGDPSLFSPNYVQIGGDVRAFASLKTSFGASPNAAAILVGNTTSQPLETAAGGQTAGVIINSFNGSRIQAGVSHSVILGGNAILATASNTVYVPYLNIKNFTGTTAVAALNIDANGNVVTGTTVVATSPFSAGTGSNSAILLGGGNLAGGQLSLAGGGAANTTQDYAFAFGDIVNANGIASQAFGSETTATGNYSHAEGLQSTAIGNQSHAEGRLTIAQGASSHSEGDETTASNTAAHAEGRQTRAAQLYSHAEGWLTFANGDATHAEGYLTTASGNYSHAEGGGTTAIGEASHAEGNSSKSFGIYSHTEGSFTTASGDSAHAEGILTIASNDYAHAEGTGSQASGLASHAEGNYTVASGNHSHAEGAQTTASDAGSHAGGIGAVANKVGEWARSSLNSTKYGQYGIVDYMHQSTTSGMEEIFIANVTNERFDIPSGSAFKYTLTMIARSSAGAAKEWKAEGLIKNVGGTTSMVGSSNTSTWADAGLATAFLGVGASDINDTLMVEITGIAATTINWYGKLEYTRIG